jgi:hypothetical protein
MNSVKILNPPHLGIRNPFAFSLFLFTPFLGLLVLDPADAVLDLKS